MMHATDSPNATTRIVRPGLVPLLAIVATILVGTAALGYYSMMSARDAAAAAACSNHLKQVGTALTLYRQVEQHYPPAAVVDETGKPVHSWRVLILPYLGYEDAQAVYKQYNFDEPWDGPNNKQLASKMPEVYACPAGNGKPGETNYVAVVGDETLWPDPKSASPFRQYFQDKVAATIAITETAESFNWLEPRDLAFDDAVFKLHTADSAISSNHGGGARVVFADSHVESIQPDTTLERLRALLTANGGENLGNGPYLVEW